MSEQTNTPGAADVGPQFWESHPATRDYPNRVYFTAEGDGRVIAGGSGTGAMLSAVQAASLAAWLLRVSRVEERAARAKGYADQLNASLRGQA